MADGADVYRVGPNLSVPRGELHKEIRSLFLHKFRQQGGLPLEDHGVVLLQGGRPLHLYNSDNELLFRQEAFFHYLFGVNDAEGFYGAFDLRTERAILFMPRLPPSYAVWMGHIPTPGEVQAKYGVHEVRYVDEMAAVLSDLAAPCLHVLEGTNSDSGLPMRHVHFNGIKDFTLETKALFPAAILQPGTNSSCSGGGVSYNSFGNPERFWGLSNLQVLTEARVVKTAKELEVMRYACQVASSAHVEVMRAVKPGMWEYQAESLYLHSIYSNGGCRGPHYTPIVASGPNAAILHYGHAGAPNDRQMQDGELLLVDAGAEYYRYAADITTTFPVNGRFTADQALVYNAVLAANRAVIAAMRPGVRWPDMHVLAERTILAALLAGGLLKGAVQEMVDARLGAVFMPHGLGHLLGLDTHDVGGYLPGHPERPTAVGMDRLRTARVLEAGMVITVEPGCYFNRVLLEPAFEDPILARFLVEERLRQFLGFGGVRIEDDVVVTREGAESMCQLPRTIQEIEAVMAGGPWPPPSST